MKNLGLLSDLSRRLSSLKRDERGVSAVEFAMLLPLMITLYLGAVEISQGVSINRKVTLTSRTVADLASQVSSISGGDMTNLLNASAAVIAPFPAGNLKVTVSQVSIDQNNVAKVKLELHAQRHQACSWLDRYVADRAQCRQYQFDLERGLLQLRTDHRLCGHGRAQSAGPDLHAAAALGHGDRTVNLLTAVVSPYHGIGNAVVDLIFSIAKRDVTFLSGTAAISFL